MSIWKRAYLYVTRKKIRSMLLFLIFFMSGLFLLTGFSIRHGAGEEAKNIHKTLKTGLKIERKLSDPFTTLDISTNEKGEEVLKYKVPFLLEKHIEELLSIEGVSGFYCENLERPEGNTGLILHPGYHTWCLGIMDGTVPLEGEADEEFRNYLLDQYQGASEAGAHTNSFIEVYDSKWHPAFVNGGVELVEGRHIGIKDVAKVVISDELAERNGLKIGDKIEVQNADIQTGDLYGSVYETEIVGIFHINFEQKVTSNRTDEKDILANTLFSTPDIDQWSMYEYQVWHGIDIVAAESDRHLRTMILFVENPAFLDSVKEKLLAMDSVDWSYYDIESYDKDYQTAAAPLISMMKVSNLLVLISVVGVLWILFFVLTIWMQSRRYEIGILYSTGVKMHAILLQIILECCSIAVIAFLVALLVAGPVTKLMGDGLQALFYFSGDTRGYEVIIGQQSSAMEINMLPAAKGEALFYGVSQGETCFIFLIVIGTAVVSVLASSLKILRQKPLEILHH